MSKAEVLGLIRHALTFIGGILLTKGVIDESFLTEAVGGVIGLIGAIWSVVSKKKSA